jgi:hypothetical protein
VRPQASVRATGGPLASWLDTSGFELRGFVQAQGQLEQQSQDQLMQGGNELNRDGFVVRRARIGVARTWDYAGLAFELDANTINGTAVGLRRAEALALYPSPKESKVPFVALAVGVTDIPFGRELPESSQARLFMERSTVSLALFPGEADIGARVWGGYREFRYAVAVLAGEPINERAGLDRPDPNAAKDIVSRFGVDAYPTERVNIAGGVSLVVGTGFHAGRDAIKDSVEWRDLNENGAVELGELFSVPGSAAVPSENFRRWGLALDLAVGVQSRFGWTRVAAEVTVASNLDRGLFVADPIVTGSDIRHLGASVSVVQDFGGRFVGGLRFDFYDPNLDALDSRSGMQIPRDETITTVSPLVALRLPRHLRAVLQYDHVIDNLARDTRGVPTDLANNRFTARLQVDL